MEASAFTQIDFLEGAADTENSIDITFDRPFIYGITASNGSLLFVWVCMNPLE